MTTAPRNKRRRAHFARYVLIGFFTLAPLWVTWLVFDFLLGLLASAGTPLLLASASLVSPWSTTLADWLHDSSFQKLIGVVVALALLYGTGLLASVVIGKRLIDLFERALARLPLVQTIYGATKRFLQTLRQPPVSGQRVVLINFPTPAMRAIGFITRILKDVDSGRELAAVYVPTSPNPTSGYIEIVPLSEVVMTDWTMEEAMRFVMTGGTNAPETIRFSQPGPPK